MSCQVTKLVPKLFYISIRPILYLDIAIDFKENIGSLSDRDFEIVEDYGEREREKMSRLQKLRREEKRREENLAEAIPSNNNRSLPRVSIRFSTR